MNIHCVLEIMEQMSHSEATFNPKQMTKSSLPSTALTIITHADESRP